MKLKAADQAAVFDELKVRSCWQILIRYSINCATLPSEKPTIMKLVSLHATNKNHVNTCIKYHTNRSFPFVKMSTAEGEFRVLVSLV